MEEFDLFLCLFLLFFAETSLLTFKGSIKNNNCWFNIHWIYIAVKSNEKKKKNLRLPNVRSQKYLNIRSWFRSSPLELFLGKDILKIGSKFTGEQPCQSVISIKLLEIALGHGCSPVNLLHIFRTPFCKSTYGELLLIISCWYQ